ncbi:10597_t:CDS:2, partial [Gigaspora rosea]
DIEEVEDPMVFNLEKSGEKEEFDEYIRFTKFREQYHLKNEYSSNEELQSYQEPEQYESSSESSNSDEEYLKQPKNGHGNAQRLLLNPSEVYSENKPSSKFQVSKYHCRAFLGPKA